MAHALGVEYADIITWNSGQPGKRSHHPKYDGIVVRDEDVDRIRELRRRVFEWIGIEWVNGYERDAWDLQHRRCLAVARRLLALNSHPSGRASNRERR